MAERLDELRVAVVQSSTKFMNASSAVELCVHTITWRIEIEIDIVEALVPSFDAELVRAESDGCALNPAT